MTDSKWRVYKQNLRTSEKLYKRYKTSEGWTRDPHFAYAYTKQGATKIQERINVQYKMYNMTSWLAGIEVVSNAD